MAWTPDDIPDLTGRRALAAHGAEVVLAARNEERLERTRAKIVREVPGALLQPLVVDLAEQASVRRAAALAATYGPLHLLVNNAGVMATPQARTVDGFD